MLTRAQFQDATGLSRKAIRVYQAMGLLNPQRNASNFTVFEPDAVTIGQAIYLLRCANVPLADIKKLIYLRDDYDEEFVNSLIEKLQKDSQDALNAIRKVREIQQSVRSDVFKTRYGGFWAAGLEKTIEAYEIEGFLFDTAKKLMAKGLQHDSMCMRYTTIASNAVQIRCFVKCNLARDAEEFDLRSYYIPEKLYFGLKTRSRFGDIASCKAVCKRILTARSKLDNKQSHDEVLTIYENVSVDVDRNQEVDVIVLS